MVEEKSTFDEDRESVTRRVEFGEMFIVVRFIESVIALGEMVPAESFMPAQALV